MSAIQIHQLYILRMAYNVIWEKWSRMASSCKVGEVVYIDGFLKHCDDDKVLLEPAILRDPTAKFIPIKAGGK